MSGAEFGRTGLVGGLVFVVIAIIVILIVILVIVILVIAVDCRDYLLVLVIMMVSRWRVGHSCRDWLVGHSSLMAVMESSMRVGHSSRDWFVGYSAYSAILATHSDSRFSTLRLMRFLFSHFFPIVAFTDGFFAAISMGTSHGLSRNRCDVISTTAASVIAIVSIVLIWILGTAIAFIGALNFPTMPHTLHRIIGDLITRRRFHIIGRRDVNANGEENTLWHGKNHFEKYNEIES